MWLRSKFPDHKEIQAGYRAAAGTARVLPSPEVALQTQGAAIDWWIRFLADPAPALGLVLSGLAEIQGPPCSGPECGLVAGLGGINRNLTVTAVDPARFADRSDEWWARVSYALALLTAPRRACSIEGSRLMQLDPGRDVRDLLALANGGQDPGRAGE